MVVRRYAEKISGPIRDRIDINQGFLPLRKAYLKAALQRVGVLGGGRRAGAGGPRPAAPASGRHRLADQRRGVRHLPAPAPAAPDGLQTVDEAYDRGRLSARGVDKVLRLAGPLPILPVATCRAATSWRSRWRCGGVSSRGPCAGGGLSHDRRRIGERGCCSRCAMDGGDPAVAELVQNLGAEGAWAKIIEGVLGEPAAQRAAPRLTSMTSSGWPSGGSTFRRSRRRRVAGRA